MSFSDYTREHAHARVRKYTRKITRFGNSKGITLPRELLQRLGLEVGGWVDIALAADAEDVANGAALRVTALPGAQEYAHAPPFARAPAPRRARKRKK